MEGVVVEDDRYSQFEHLRFERPSDGVLLITIDRPEQMNATNERLHGELGEIWPVISADPGTRVAVITGAGKAFSAGGDLEMLDAQVGDVDHVYRLFTEAAAIVYNMVNCPKPIVSAINGVAVGAGLAVALMADISIISQSARFTDGHLRLGVAAGDHSVVIWPLLCGMARAKYYLLTADFIDGAEAERIGLVSKAVPPDELMPTALKVAGDLAAGPQHAIRWTKHALNNWLRSAGPHFDASLAMEMLGFFHGDVVEGVQALREKRPPQFPSASTPDRDSAGDH